MLVGTRNQLLRTTTNSLDSDSLASQWLAHCGRVAKTIGVASSTLLAAGAVSNSTRARCNVVASAGILHLQTKLPQILKCLLSIQLAVVVLQQRFELSASDSVAVKESQ